MNAVLRNSGEGAEPHQILCLGPLLADLDAREVSVDSRSIALTATEFDLLVDFMHHSGQVIARDKLMTDVWRTRTLSRQTCGGYVRGVCAPR